MVRYLVFFSVFVCLILPEKADATDLKRDTAKVDSTKNTLVLVPLIFLKPETSWGTGGAGVFVFRDKAQKKKLSLPPSQMQFGFSYTLLKQFLAKINYQYYFADNKYTLYGEVSHFSYSYDFFGVGDDIDFGISENYAFTYSRFRINALKRFLTNNYIGIRYWREDFSVVKTHLGGKLESGSFTGSEGGLTSGLGFVWNYDTRDFYFYPSKGVYFEIGTLQFEEGLGSDFNFTKVSIDLTKYHGFKWGHVLAVNAYTELNFGDPPFNQMAMIGGKSRMRGYYEGVLRNRHVAMLQGEYRMRLWWKLGAVVFAGAGDVVHDVKDFSMTDLRYNYGAGLRFVLNEKEKFNLRFDAGFGPGTKGFYVSVREAF